MGLTYRAFQTYEIDEPQLSTQNAYTQRTIRPAPVKVVAPKPAPKPPKPPRKRALPKPTPPIDTSIIDCAELIANKYLGGYTAGIRQALRCAKARPNPREAVVRFCTFGRLNAEYGYANAEIAKAFGIHIQTVQIITKRWKADNEAARQLHAARREAV
jgi:hypothetical protein